MVKMLRTATFLKIEKDVRAFCEIYSDPENQYATSFEVMSNVLIMDFEHASVPLSADTIYWYIEAMVTSKESEMQDGFTAIVLLNTNAEEKSLPPEVKKLMYARGVRNFFHT